MISWCISHENAPSECHLNDHCGHDNWQCAIRSTKKSRLAKDIEAHPKWKSKLTLDSTEGLAELNDEKSEHSLLLENLFFTQFMEKIVS